MRTRITIPPEIDPVGIILARVGMHPNTPQSRALTKATLVAVIATEGEMTEADLWALSQDALGLLDAFAADRVSGRFVFAGTSGAANVISESQFKVMLGLIGFRGEMTPSGFRSMAATLLSEQAWNPDAIERQRSHADPRSMPRACNFAEYLPVRRRMMQAWADHLDKLAES
jgi:hypothetical protein